MQADSNEHHLSGLGELYEMQLSRAGCDSTRATPAGGNRRAMLKAMVPGTRLPQAEIGDNIRVVLCAPFVEQSPGTLLG